MVKRAYLECTAGTSNKFWRCVVDGNRHHICYGRIGTSGANMLKDFSDQDEAISALSKLIGEKKKKGYVQKPDPISDASTITSTPPARTIPVKEKKDEKPAPMKFKAAKPEPGSSAVAGDGVDEVLAILLGAGIPYVSAEIYAAKLTSQGFDCQAAIATLTMGDLGEIDMKLGHKRLMMKAVEGLSGADEDEAPMPPPPKRARRTPAVPAATSATGPTTVPGKPLSGLVVCVSGQMSVVRKMFHDWLMEHGAMVVKSVTGSTTHLITTASEADNPTRKVLEALKKGKPCVCEGFVRECVKQGKLVDSSPFTLIGEEGLDGDAASTTGGGAATRALIGAAKARAVKVSVKTNAGSEAAATQVMLADKFDWKKNPTGMWISEKLDGVRAYWDGENFYSRNGNVFPSPEWFKAGLPNTPLDGELWCGRRLFRRCLSIVRNAGSGDLWQYVTYLVFDLPESSDPYEQRVERIKELVKPVSKPEDLTTIERKGFKGCPFAAPIGTHECRGEDHLKDELKVVLDKGGEGLMLRKPKSKYEKGKRSSTILKVKPVVDEEAKVVGHEGGKGRNQYRMGALILETPDGRQLRCGTGFTDLERNTPPPVGSIVTYRYTELMDNGFPRFPRFVSTRTDLDWEKYCEEYSAPAKESFESGELRREHSVLYASPALTRTLSSKAESLDNSKPDESTTDLRGGATGYDSGNDTEAYGGASDEEEEEEDDGATADSQLEETAKLLGLTPEETRLCVRMHRRYEKDPRVLGRVLQGADVSTPVKSPAMTDPSRFAEETGLDIETARSLIAETRKTMKRIAAEEVQE